MAGVEILATEKVVSEYGQCFSWDLFWGMFLTALVFCIFISILYLVAGHVEIGLCLIIIGVIVSVLFSYIAANFAQEPIAYKNQYKVTISDEVGMNEFNKRYKVIDQEGKIYTVEEREN